MKLFVAVPIYGSVDPWFMRALMGMASNPPVEMVLRASPGDSLVTRARNVLTADFLASDCTDLLFIDSDIVFTPADVERIANNGALLVGGCYPLKQVGPVQWCANCLKEPQPVGDDGLQEVAYVGTGFMRINRWVFEAMISRGLVEPYKPDQSTREEEWDFWSVGVYKYPDGSRRYLSEDWMFCQRFRDMGGSVCMDTKIQLRHMGTVAYPIEAAKLEEVAS